MDRTWWRNRDEEATMRLREWSREEEEDIMEIWRQKQGLGRKKEMSRRDEEGKKCEAEYTGQSEGGKVIGGNDWSNRDQRMRKKGIMNYTGNRRSWKDMRKNTHTIKKDIKE